MQWSLLALYSQYHIFGTIPPPETPNIAHRKKNPLKYYKRLLHHW
jgi:hypothetical protein